MDISQRAVISEVSVFLLGQGFFLFCFALLLEGLLQVFEEGKRKGRRSN